MVVPANKTFWNVFKGDNEIFIPFSQICKIGEDTILVELYSTTRPNVITLENDDKNKK